MKKAIFTVLVIFSFAGVFAQEVEFTADRPGASTGPSTVAKGVIQWEQGVQYDGDGGKGALTFSSTLFRYGLFDGVELRLAGDGFIVPFPVLEPRSLMPQGQKEEKKVLSFVIEGNPPTISPQLRSWSKMRAYLHLSMSGLAE